MKKKITSAFIAAVMVTALVLGSLTGIISAAVIDKSGYPFANNKLVPVYDYSANGTDTNTINSNLGEYVSFADGKMQIAQAMTGKSAKMYQQTQAPAENNGMYITVKNTNNVAVVLGFMPYVGSNTLPKGIEGSKYYLIKGDKYEEFEYGSDENYTAITIPANYEGQLVVKFSSYLKGKNTFEAADVEGYFIVFYDVPENEKQYMIFDDFGFIGVEKEAGELDESEYPYTASNRWDEFSFEEVPQYSTAGTVGEITALSGKLNVKLPGAAAGSGIKFPITSAYTGSYDAVYFKVMSTESTLIAPKWAVGGKNCALKANGEYYVRNADGSLYKKTANSDGAIAVNANEEIAVTVPYGNIVIEGSVTAIPAKPVFTEFGFVLASATALGDDAVLVLDDIGFIKTKENSFIIPPKMNGNTVTEKDLNFTLTEESKLLLDPTKNINKLYNCETIAGVTVDQRNIVVDGKRGHGIPISGNPMFELSFSMTKEHQGLVFDIDTTEAAKDINIQLQFTQNGTYYRVSKNRSYYLINDADGLIYRYTQTEKGAEDSTIFIPMNFKGKVLITFESLKSAGTNEPYDPETNMSKVAIQFVDLNGVNAKESDIKQLWINNVYQVKDLDSVGDKAYKIDLKMINLEVSGRGLMNSDVSPASGMDPTYWLYSHAEDFVNCFTTDGAFEGTGERLTAVRAIGNRNCWGVGYGGSWTCVNKNAIVYYIDATGAPNLSYKPLLFPNTMKSYPLTDENGNVILKRDGDPKTARYSMGRWTLTSESKIFFVSENSVRAGHPKAKLGNVSGNNVVMNGFKGFVVIPFLEMKPDGDAVGECCKDGTVTLHDISLVTGVSLQFMMGGMTEGEYVTFDYSGLAYVECPGIIETWNPTGGGAPEEEGGGGTIVPGPPTGVNKTAAVGVAALLGAGALGFGGYDVVSKKRKANRAEKRGER